MANTKEEIALDKREAKILLGAINILDRKAKKSSRAEKTECFIMAKSGLIGALNWFPPMTFLDIELSKLKR